MEKFIIAYTKDISSLLNLGKEQSKFYKGEFNGNTQFGTFNFRALGGTFAGKYFVKEKIIEIELSKKPFFIPRSAIENFLKIQLNKT